MQLLCFFCGAARLSMAAILAGMLSLLPVFGLDGAEASGHMAQEEAPKLLPPEIADLSMPKEADASPLLLSPSAVSTSPLKICEPLKERTLQLELVAREADNHTRHGFELAGKGAYFAARAEFFLALRLIAEGLDAEQKTNVHSRAFLSANTALKEAEDFLPSSAEIEPDVARLVAAHETPVLKQHPENITPMQALSRYFTFAQEQFAAAAGEEIAGSMALHALGKLHDVLAAKKNALTPAAAAKAIVFYQAAMLVYPGNYMAANDLGVLLARCGNPAAARNFLEHALKISPQAATYHNLAVVYQQLGLRSASAWAQQQAALLASNLSAQRAASPTAGNMAVRWVQPQTLAENPAVEPGSNPPPTAIPAESRAAKPLSARRATTPYKR